MEPTMREPTVEEVRPHGRHDCGEDAEPDSDQFESGAPFYGDYESEEGGDDGDHIVLDDFTEVVGQEGGAVEALGE